MDESLQARLPGKAVPVTTVDASNPSSVIALANDTKVKYNELTLRFNELVNSLRAAKLGI